MSTEIKAAFGHPIERSEATAPDQPLDRISLRDHIVEVEIGAFQSERDVTQRLSFNVVVEVEPLSDPVEDDVDRILSYDKVTEAIAAELAAERLNLLETLADRIAARILLEPQADRVFVRIEKLDRGPGALGVEIVRGRATRPLSQRQENAPRPRLVYLSNAAITSPHLAGWLDQLQGGAAPVLLTVGLPEGEVPRGGDTRGQRHIDLLAIEQNAWLLAGRDARCVVVDSRTELDWAMKHGQISVWAPGKIVLDAVEGPALDPVDGRVLSRWMAQQLDAAEEIWVGTDSCGPGAIPSRVIAVDEPQI